MTVCYAMTSLFSIWTHTLQLCTRQCMSSKVNHWAPQSIDWVCCMLCRALWAKLSHPCCTWQVITDLLKYINHKSHSSFPTITPEFLVANQLCIVKWNWWIYWHLVSAHRIVYLSEPKYQTSTKDLMSPKQSEIENNCLIYIVWE